MWESDSDGETRAHVGSNGGKTAVGRWRWPCPLETHAKEERLSTGVMARGPEAGDEVRRYASSLAPLLTHVRRCSLMRAERMCVRGWHVTGELSPCPQNK